MSQQVTVYSSRGTVLQRVQVQDPIDGTLLSVRSVDGVNGLATRDTDLRAIGEEVRELVVQLRAIGMAAGITSDPLALANTENR